VIFYGAKAGTAASLANAYGFSLIYLISMSVLLAALVRLFRRTRLSYRQK
jgi:hypothetical protein